MNKSIIINITQEDIDNGRPLTAEDCPVALAIRRTLCKRDNEVFVDSKRIIVKNYLEGSSIYGFKINTPDFVSDFIKTYDKQNMPKNLFMPTPEVPIKPFSFEIDYSTAKPVFYDEMCI